MMTIMETNFVDSEIVGENNEILYRWEIFKIRSWTSKNWFLEKELGPAFVFLRVCRTLMLSRPWYPKYLKPCWDVGGERIVDQMITRFRDRLQSSCHQGSAGDTGLRAGTVHVFRTVHAGRQYGYWILTVVDIG